MRWNIIENTHNLIGEKFGRLTVIKKDINKQNRAYWLCKCDCGNPNLVSIKESNLKRGITKSCGCIRKENTKKFNKQTKSKYNKYDLSGTYGIGWTSNTNHEFYFDLEDYNKIKNYCWFEHVIKDGYRRLECRIKGDNHIITMAQLLFNDLRDHINRNPFDNRKNNLRKCDNEQNAINHSKRKDNTSGVIGVNYSIKQNKWVARIGYNKTRLILGSYDYFNDAVISRLKAEKKYYGEFAPQKELFNKYNI